MIVNLSGRGDKDMQTVARAFGSDDVSGTSLTANDESAGRIAAKFSELRARGEAALIPYIVAGDPDLDAHARGWCSNWKRAAPTSSNWACRFPIRWPTVPPISAPPHAAWPRARSFAAILSMVGELAQETQIPLVLFGYYNPIHALRMRAAVRRRRARGRRWLAGRRSAARGGG